MKHKLVKLLFVYGIIISGVAGWFYYETQKFRMKYNKCEENAKITN